MIGLSQEIFNFFNENPNRFIHYEGINVGVKIRYWKKNRRCPREATIERMVRKMAKEAHYFINASGQRESCVLLPFDKEDNNGKYMLIRKNKGGKQSVGSSVGAGAASEPAPYPYDNETDLLVALEQAEVDGRSI